MSDIYRGDVTRARRAVLAAAALTDPDGDPAGGGLQVAAAEFGADNAPSTAAVVRSFAAGFEFAVESIAEAFIDTDGGAS